jgi:hypothetical protein
VVVVTQTRSVIPLASLPTLDSSCGGVVTVTVALTTVTVTANMPDTFSAMAVPTTATDDDVAPATLSSAPLLTTASESAPYAYSNGTSSRRHHHRPGTGGHSHMKAHATPARMH